VPVIIAEPPSTSEELLIKCAAIPPERVSVLQQLVFAMKHELGTRRQDVTEPTLNLFSNTIAT